MRTTSVPRLILAFALTGAALAGCGGSDDDAAPADSSAQESSDAGAGDAGTTEGGSADASGGSGSTDGGVAEAIGGEDMGDVLDSVGLETKGSALVTATGAERFEMEGDVGHLYLGDDAGVPQGTECMIVGAVLSEGEQVVVHLADGSEVTCP